MLLSRTLNCDARCCVVCVVSDVVDAVVAIYVVVVLLLLLLLCCDCSGLLLLICDVVFLVIIHVLSLCVVDVVDVVLNMLVATPIGHSPFQTQNNVTNNTVFCCCVGSDKTGAYGLCCVGCHCCQKRTCKDIVLTVQYGGLSPFWTANLHRCVVGMLICVALLCGPCINATPEMSVLAAT